MSDDTNRRDARSPGEDEAFWEDEGGDRTITSPFEPPSHLEQPGTMPLAFGVLGSDLPPALPSAAPEPAPAPALPDPPHHIVVGSDGVGDEATLAVSAPDIGTSQIAAALAATLGGAPLPQPEVWSPPPSLGPLSRPHGPHGTSPVAMTLAGPASSPMQPGVQAYPSSGAMPALPPANPASAGMAARPPYPSSGVNPAAPWPAPATYAAPVVPVPGQALRPQPPAGPGRTSFVLLAVFGVVCLTIFVVGVVLFLRTNS